MQNIINIVNFIRAFEPRNPDLDLVQPVREQIRLMRENDLPGTFLLQYDAMLREDILKLLLPLDPEQFEIGIWLEMNRPHVEAAGLKWRGRPGFDWDWHAHVGFSVGYTPAEREKLVDVAFEKHRAIWGCWPRTVGSWMIDAHTLAYMAEKYHIIASCNCKDQWGTDGYTIWGGYWNQGYYPSRNNVLSPAQTAENQIPVPLFRMLGSDPVSQYDLGLRIDEGASECQHVASLEPAYNSAGADPKWVEWFMRQNFSGNSLAFAYAQAGQENSFGWPAMQAGLSYQFPLFARLRAEGLRVERMEDTGTWYKRNFDRTPQTAVPALEPLGERDSQSVWYNCVNYRINLYRDGNGLRIRDMFLFDEDYAERYMVAKCETEYLVYDNLPVVDGNRNSGSGILAGGWVVKRSGDGWTAPACGEMRVRESGGLDVSFCVGQQTGSFRMDERGVSFEGTDMAIELRWDWKRSACVDVKPDRIEYSHNARRYALAVRGGTVSGGKPGSIMLVPGGTGMRLELLRQGEL